ncbi:MAG: amidohydrolase family protein [Pseudohongiella sp.]|uniref:amidohydrolase family protein n=1 Tax=Pseudohongiella sp. TaxID=1979412 RepID=UPI00349FF17D
MPAIGAPIALTGARIVDGTGNAPIENGVLVITDGRITAVGSADRVDIPEDAIQQSLAGKTLIPGFINTHGHVGAVRGLESGHYNRDNLLRQLALYARYGVTTVISLGDDESEGFTLRDQQNTMELDRARLYVAGPVLSAQTPADASALVDDTAVLSPDFIKIRVDDNLGRTAKMPAEVYQAFSDRADHHGIPLAVHTYYLQDTKDLIRAGADFIAHSVRDTHVDSEFVNLMLTHNLCYSPTLTRELSTYVYESEPAFFADPFFLTDADPQVLATLREPERQQRLQNNAAAQQYKASLPIAMANVKILADAGVQIAMGTDSGPPARFQGYFEHLEMWMMQDAGMSAMQILQSATGGAAECMGLSDTGTLETGKWADLLVMGENPVQDIKNTRSLEQVWIAGKPVHLAR